MSEELKNLYSLIFREHPRTNLEPIHEVKLYVVQESLKKREVTARETWIELKKYPKRVIDNSMKWLYEKGYIKRRKVGSGFFFTEEKKDGSFGNRYYSRIEIDEVKKENSKMILKIIENRPSLLNKEIEKHYLKLSRSWRKGDPNLNSYNFLIESLWENGFSKLVKLFFKSTAYRYSK